MFHVAQGEKLAPAYLLRFDETIIGYFLSLLGYSPEHGGMDGFIDDIYLTPEWRGRDLGRKALDLAVEVARNCGVRVLMLEAALSLSAKGRRSRDGCIPLCRVSGKSSAGTTRSNAFCPCTG